MQRSTPVTGEIYHVYNRGVDKRNIFTNSSDIQRFLASIEFFNTVNKVGSLNDVAIKSSGPTTGFYQRRNKHNRNKHENHLDENEQLVEIIAYHILPNHFHFLLKQVAENGISEFMKRVAGGYTRYFNDKHDRSGSLLQGKYKACHVYSDEYFRFLVAYITLNDLVHRKHWSFPVSANTRNQISSKAQYIHQQPGLCSITDTSEYLGNAAFWRESHQLVNQLHAQRVSDTHIAKLLIE